MNILITGVNGFVGSNLVYALHSHNIYSLSRNSSGKNKVISNYSWNEIEKIPLVDVVVHLAGKAHDIKNKSNVQSYFDINTGLTQKIFDWFRESKAKKFIFFSSVKAVADTVHDILIENMIPVPEGPYGESKLKAEEYIKKYWADYVNSSRKQVYILRPCMIHGPGNKGNLNLLYTVVRRGIPWPLGSFDNRHSFISIENVSYIINRLIEQDITSDIFNIADDDTISTNELIKIMCEIISCKCRIWHINKNLIQNIAMLGDVFHLPLNQERLRKLTQNFVVSNKKIKKTLSISRLPFSAKEGLIKTISSL